jgi:hypothetical protein
MNDWPHIKAAQGLRQWPVLQRLCDRIEAAPALDGALLIGSFARGAADHLSDVDLIVVAKPGLFDRAWAARDGLHGSDTAAWFDDLVQPSAEMGGHKWMTRDLVFVECLIATPTSGVRTTEDVVVLVGDPVVKEWLPKRPPIRRAEMTGGSWEIERLYDALKNAMRSSG